MPYKDRKEAIEEFVALLNQNFDLEIETDKCVREKLEQFYDLYEKEIRFKSLMKARPLGIDYIYDDLDDLIYDKYGSIENLKISLYGKQKYMNQYQRFGDYRRSSLDGYFGSKPVIADPETFYQDKQFKADQYLMMRINFAMDRELVANAVDGVLDEVCQVCGKPMLYRIDKFGKTAFCADWPHCNNKYHIDEGAVCDKCGSIMYVYHSEGRDELICSNLLECGNHKKVKKGSGKQSKNLSNAANPFNKLSSEEFLMKCGDRKYYNVKDFSRIAFRVNMLFEDRQQIAEEKDGSISLIAVDSPENKLHYDNWLEFFDKVTIMQLAEFAKAGEEDLLKAVLGDDYDMAIDFGRFLSSNWPHPLDYLTEKIYGSHTDPDRKPFYAVKMEDYNLPEVETLDEIMGPWESVDNYLEWLELGKRKCSKCGSPMIKIYSNDYLGNGRSRREIVYTFSCINSHCGHIDKLPCKPTGINCPECGSEMYKVQSRKFKDAYKCSAFPKCRTAFWGKPAGRRCPECGSHLIAEKEIITCSSSSCDYLEAKESDREDNNDNL